MNIAFLCELLRLPHENKRMRICKLRSVPLRILKSGDERRLTVLRGFLIVRIFRLDPSDPADGRRGRHRHFQTHPTIEMSVRHPIQGETSRTSKPSKTLSGQLACEISLKMKLNEHTDFAVPAEDVTVLRVRLYDGAIAA